MLGRKEPINPCVPVFLTVLINKRDGGLMDKKHKLYFPLVISQCLQGRFRTTSIRRCFDGRGVETWSYFLRLDPHDGFNVEELSTRYS